MKRNDPKHPELARKSQDVAPVVVPQRRSAGGGGAGGGSGGMGHTGRGMFLFFFCELLLSMDGVVGKVDSLWCKRVRYWGDLRGKKKGETNKT